MKKAAASLIFAGILLKSCSAQGIDLPCANQVVQASEGCGQSLELFCSSDCYGIALQYYCRTPDDRSALIDACAVSYPASNYPGLSDLPPESTSTTSAPNGEETSSSAEEDAMSSAASDASPTSSTAGASSPSNSTDCESIDDCTESTAKPAKTKGPHKNETSEDSAAMLTFQPAANPVFVGLLGATLAFFNALL